jgi:hypothetical protein
MAPQTDVGKIKKLSIKYTVQTYLLPLICHEAHNIYEKRCIDYKLHSISLNFGPKYSSLQ